MINLPDSHPAKANTVAVAFISPLNRLAHEFCVKATSFQTMQKELLGDLVEI
jgi:hypothetical protein